MRVSLYFSYETEALLAALRIIFWFILLYRFIAPLFLVYTRKLPPIEKLIYSWTGLGGIILFLVFVLTSFHIYDFISFSIALLLIPLIHSYWHSDEKNVLAYLQERERKTLVKHIRLIERSNYQSLLRLLKLKLYCLYLKWKKERSAIPVLTIAFAGGFIRIYPALINAAPFSRKWFWDLERIKNLRLQNYFVDSFEPAGMHSFVSVFSMLTQLSPEMILHLLSGLTGFFICLLIYWITKSITRSRFSMPSIFAMTIYALAPALLLPISLDQQVEASSLNLALCFALPTLMISIQNVRSRHRGAWFYAISGFIATAMTSLFIALLLLVPLLGFSLFYLIKKDFLKVLVKNERFLFAFCAIALFSYVVFEYVNLIALESFLLSQLYNVHAYSYYPLLIMPLENLSWIYALIAATLIFYFLANKAITKNPLGDRFIFLCLFIVLALLNVPETGLNKLLNVDTDQLNGLYALMIAIFFGLLYMMILELLAKIKSFSSGSMKAISGGLFLTFLLMIFYAQGGIQVSRLYPKTMPNGFFKAYYKIIDEQLPYSYAIVGPRIHRIIAKNRHYFMSYEYFTSEYKSIDSLYYEQLQQSKINLSSRAVPPSSIFIFTEKPPYKSIQQSILYDSRTVMQNIRRWLSHYRELPGRRLEVYYSDKTSTIYEIVNREESAIDDILGNVYPQK